MEVEGALPNALSPFLDMSKSIEAALFQGDSGQGVDLARICDCWNYIAIKADWKRICLIFFHLHYSIFIYYSYSMM